jgi:tellurite resistance protein
VPSSRSIRETVADPGAAAARGRWLARGAWLLAAAEVVIAVRNHVTDRLTAKERKRMVEIVRSSKGRPSNLSDRERRELRGLLGKVEPRELAKKVATSPSAGRLRRRR